MSFETWLYVFVGSVMFVSMAATAIYVRRKRADIMADAQRMSSHLCQACLVKLLYDPKIGRWRMKCPQCGLVYEYPEWYKAFNAGMVILIILVAVYAIIKTFTFETAGNARATRYWFEFIFFSIFIPFWAGMQNKAKLIRVGQVPPVKNATQK